MQPAVILFGSTGTLIDTSDLERRAFNRAFREAGLDWVWDPALYRDLMRGTDWQKRIASFAEDRGLIVDEAALIARKAEILSELLQRSTLPLRKGVLSLISAATASSVPLAIATTESAIHVDAVLRSSGGLLSHRLFRFIGTEEMVATSKPDPAAYQVALRALGVRPGGALAVENSAPGVAAAVAAGVPTIAFPNSYSVGPFAGALAVVRELTPEQMGLGALEFHYAKAS